MEDEYLCSIVSKPIIGKIKLGLVVFNEEK